jgi:hypothetical protein
MSFRELVKKIKSWKGNIYQPALRIDVLQVSFILLLVSFSLPLIFPPHFETSPTMGKVPQIYSKKAGKIKSFYGKSFYFLESRFIFAALFNE